MARRCPHEHREREQRRLARNARREVLAYDEGLAFDARTLELIDSDKDGRIRATELIAAVKWAGALLKNPDDCIRER